MQKKQLLDNIISLDQTAVEIGKKMGYDLDHSNNSVEDVEKIIKTLSNKGKKEEFSKVANIFGTYVGTTFIKNLGQGSWELEPVHQAIAVKIKDEYIFFPAKIFRKLSDKKESIKLLYTSAFNRYSKEKISFDVFSNN